ncbi:cation:dicarboxylate symporter family transporter [Thalassotalea euphylliae]|uniref:cation:dicarboxylate symporter family transporter n=1 Tax=Thalassotalea euphylliae TaxID=1655234 RepID=UPI0036397998
MAEKKKLSMSTVVLLSFAFGIVAGLFFGEKLAWMSFIGDAFIKLLQMTIIPYIMVSLISSLGGLTIQQAKSIGIQVGKLMLAIWVLGILSMFFIKFTFPTWQAGAFFSLSELTPPESVNLLDLYIPSNPFFSMSNSYIPAIVLFCVATGLSLISIKDKDVLLQPMRLLGDAFNKVTQYIVKLMPLGIFCMTAATAGTMDLQEFQKLQVYFVAHIIMTLLLTYWILPGMLALMTPFSHKDIAGIAKDAMITAFAAGNIFIVLPILIERTKELFEKYDIGEDKTKEYPNIIIPVVFSFPNLGKLLTIVFVLFAAWFAGTETSFLTYIPMAINGLISLFGSVYLTVPMLLDSLELPTDLFQLYMVSSLFTSRFTSLLAAMNIFILAVGGTAMLAGVAKINMRKLVLFSAFTPVVFGVVLLLSAWFLNSIVNTEYHMDEVVKEMSTAVELPEEAEVTYQAYLGTKVAPRSFTTIKHSGVIKVGYKPTQVPFSYFNADNKLVGFDVDMMKKLGGELGLDVVFVPYTDDNAVAALDNGQFDITISGLQMTTDMIQQVRFSRTVLKLHYSLVVRDHRTEQFSSEENIRAAGPIKLAAVGTYAIVPQIKKKYPNIEVEVIKSDKEFFEDRTNRWDGLIISLEAGKAWTILYPDYTAIFNRDEIRSFPAAYAVAQGNLSLLTFLNNWLEIQLSSGYVDQLYDYWILGKNAVPKTRRWSVVKDVFGWEEE